MFQHLVWQAQGWAGDAKMSKTVFTFKKVRDSAHDAAAVLFHQQQQKEIDIDMSSPASQ